MKQFRTYSKELIAMLDSGNITDAKKIYAEMLDLYPKDTEIFSSDKDNAAIVKHLVAKDEPKKEKLQNVKIEVIADQINCRFGTYKNGDINAFPKDFADLLVKVGDAKYV